MRRFIVAMLVMALGLVGWILPVSAAETPTCYDLAGKSDPDVKDAKCVDDAQKECTGEWEVFEEPNKCQGLTPPKVCCATFKSGTDTNFGTKDSTSKLKPSTTPVAKPKPTIQTTSLASFPNPLGSVSVPGLVNRIISGVLGLVGALFFVMFLYGGVTYMMAGGDAQAVKKATTALTNALIGVTIVAISYVIVNFIIDVLAKGIAK